MPASEAKDSEEIREALREVRGRATVVRAAETPQEARRQEVVRVSLFPIVTAAKKEAA